MTKVTDNRDGTLTIVTPDGHKLHLIPKEFEVKCPPCTHDCMEGRFCPARRKNEGAVSNNDGSDNLPVDSK